MPEAVSGTTAISYERLGSGVPVLLVPGALGGARATWGSLPDALSKHATVLMPDLRGFGRSSPVKRYTFASIPSDLALVMDHAKIPKAHIVGAGDGAVAALHLALERPERVESLALASSRAYVADEDLQFIAKERLGAHGEWWDTYRYDRAYLDVRHALHDITVQTLLVHGESDPWSGERHADILSAGLTHARSFVVGGAGYRVHESREFATLLAAFLRDRGVFTEDVTLPQVDPSESARVADPARASVDFIL